MAKKKRKAKKTSRRRRSVGALNPNNPLVKYGSIAAGYLLADKINAPIDSAVGTKLDGKIIAGVQAGAGAYLVFKKGKPSLVKSLLGGLLLGSGAKRAMASFGIGGIGNYQSVPAIAGYQDVRAVGSARTSRRLSSGVGSHGPSRVAINDATLMAAR